MILLGQLIYELITENFRAMTIQYLLLLSPLIYELLTDALRIKSGKEDNHEPDVIVRGANMAVVAGLLWYFYGVNYFTTLATTFCYFAGLFNPVLHLIIGEHPLYLRDGGIDKYLKRLPKKMLAFLYIWFLITGFVLYHSELFIWW